MMCPPSDTSEGNRGRPQGDPVAIALREEIDRILRDDFKVASRSKSPESNVCSLTDHWEQDGLGSHIEGFLRGRKHGKMLEIADSAARFFEELAAAKPLLRKGQPYGMRLREAMQDVATKRFIETVTPHLDVRDLFTYPGAPAICARLIGAADERFDRSDIVVRLVPTTRYSVPTEIQPTYEQRLTRLKSVNLERGARFDNGDILRARAVGCDCPDSDTEQKRITLELERVSWYDYSVVIDYVNECRINGMQTEVDALIDVADVVAGRMQRTRLPNPIGVALTLVTSDKFLLYVKRDAVSADPGKLSTSVCENIHLEKDRDANRSIQVFRTAERGIEEELSPGLTLRPGKLSLSLLGMSFDLNALDCGLLFLAEVAATQNEVQTMCDSNPGKDYREGRCKWVSFADHGNELSNLLARNDWTGHGKASVIRALEYLRWRQPWEKGGAHLF